MPAANTWITHTFGGGWATDFGDSYYGGPDDAGFLPFPFLVNARNIIYEFDGGPHKAPGSVKYNTTAYGGATGAIRLLFDYWRQGVAGSPTQRIIVASDNGTNTLIGQAALSATSFTNLFTNLTTGAVPHCSTFDDLLIIATDNTSDVPRSWDGTTAQNLAGTPPRFSFSVPHKNRQWAAGDFANPSRLYYSVNVDPEDWVGVGSGSIDIDPNDGDMIVGIISHKNELIVFKGPNIGSIHRITGSSPSGSDGYARIPLIRGLGGTWQNSLFRFGDDVGFISPMANVHSLAATAAYGDYNQSYLSFPISSNQRTNVTHSRLRHWQAVDNAPQGHVLISLTSSNSSANNDRVLLMDYRFLAQQERYPRWSYWDTFSLGALAMVSDTSSRRRVWAGGYTGTVWKLDQSTRTHDGTAISMQVTSPSMSYGSEERYKTIGAASISVRPFNTNSLTFGWTRDGNVQQTQTVTQGLTGAVLGVFLLGTDSLGGSALFVPRFLDLEEGGEFRAVQYDVRDGINESDLEFHNIRVRLTVGAESTEN